MDSSESQKVWYFGYVASSQERDLRFSNPPSGQDAGGEAQIRDRRVPCRFRAVYNKVISGFSGPPSGQGADGGAQTRHRRDPTDFRTDSLATVPPTPHLIV
ncbi:hypothetical protein PoB_005486300 [Plakobranchus ocellatus]|uniref:Uncharacterized protein n=1 Tax=Plakobranchus ocellatus TaxID=259542 RepID=A0AAV4C8Z6_9GAST|nr:hypothetical protein PoB_005486300 [Plakobranchus ocellatus]